jgi:hypothetical protein
MFAQEIVPACPCNRASATIKVFITEDRSILLKGYCPKCKKEFNTALTISEVLRMSLAMSKFSPTVKETPENVSTDINWLHTLGVCYLEDAS